jgi:voltage-gated sodium channel
MGSIERLLNDSRFHWFIIIAILVNAAVLGLMTLPLDATVVSLLQLIDDICLVIFCFEIGCKLIVYRLRFFRDGWNIFDFVVVAIALLPNTGALSVLRALRVLRLLRLATAVPSMRRVINGMFAALPGGASVAGVLFIMYYVAAIIGVTLFKDVPEHFGDIGTTFFTLFKMMTLEGWPDIASVVLEKHPHAWIFFVSFIIFTTFTTLNLLFGIIVDAMEKAKEEEVREEMAEQGIEVSGTSNEMRIVNIEEDVRQIRAMLTEMKASGK